MGQGAINLVVPLAGKDPRFLDLPKPLIEIGGKFLIQRVLERHRMGVDERLIFVVLKEDNQRFGMSEKLRSAFGKEPIIRTIDKHAQGSPCSILDGAEDLISNSHSLLIDLGDVVRDTKNLYHDICQGTQKITGIIPVEQKDLSPRLWGYVEADGDTALALKEKEIIPAAPWATMGRYYFSHGRDFVWGAKEMIKKRSFVYNDLFFVGPIYNELITRGGKVMISQNKIEAILGSPEEIGNFQKTFNS